MQPTRESGYSQLTQLLPKLTFDINTVIMVPFVLNCGMWVISQTFRKH